MGSSTVRAAIDGADQVSSLPPIDGRRHLNCLFFEHQLKNLCGKAYSTFAFPISGSVVSDQCIILNALRQMGSLPKVVIYGITARDLINNGVYYPASTPVFRYFDNRFNIAASCPGAYVHENNWLWSLSKCLYCFRENTKLQDIMNVWAKNVLAMFDPVKDSSNVSDVQTPLVLPSIKQIQNEARLGLNNKEQLNKYILDRKPILKQDLGKYTLAYKPFSRFAYEQQLHYVDELVSLCKTNGVYLILVNMPTCKENMEILGEGKYQTYLSAIKARVSKADFAFINLNTLNKFSCGYFYDSMHLNAVGAKIFITDLVESLRSVRMPLPGWH